MNALRGKRIAFIGAGTMGQALIKGLLADGVPARLVAAAETDAATRQTVRRRFGVRVADRAAAVLRGADVVLLAVKPQQFAGVLADAAPRISRRQLVISIAAGVPLRRIERRLPGVAVVRVMPNLPATVGCGFSALAPGRSAGARHRAMAADLFRAVGDVVELPERHFDAITAVSGSGPAYLFFLVQAWEEAARRLKLPPGVASRAIRRTLAGGLRLLDETGQAPGALAAKVASKGGTTEAALRVLARRRVAAHVMEAVQAAARRSKELTCR